MARSASYLWKNKNGVWYYLRKIPRRVQKLCESKQIMKSLKTNNKAISFEKVILLNKAYEHEWVNVIRQETVTGFSNSEEETMQLTNVVLYLVEDMLKAKGAKYSSAKD